MKPNCYIKRSTINGFTLAELLIALAILGVIATFTIPKILDSGSDGKFNAIGKETMATVSGAYQALKLNSGVSAATEWRDLTPYINYVKFDTTTLIDQIYNQAGTIQCSGANPCLLLHNGGILRYGGFVSFDDTTTTSSINFTIDPDGKVTTDSSAVTPGKSVRGFLYYNGRLTTSGTILPNTYYDSNGPVNPNPNDDPPWFSWSN